MSCHTESDINVTVPSTFRAVKISLQCVVKSWTVSNTRKTNSSHNGEMAVARHSDNIEIKEEDNSIYGNVETKTRPTAQKKVPQKIRQSGKRYY